MCIRDRNYPLRGQDEQLLCSAFDEVEFCALNEEVIKNFYDNAQDSSKSRDQHKELTAYLEPEETKADTLEALPEAQTKAELHRFWSDNTISLGLGHHTIVTIVKSPYSSSKIIIRNLTGVHAWLLKEHRVLDYSCLNDIGYSDKTALYRNMVVLGNHQKIPCTPVSYTHLTLPTICSV
eukprot:TRINITY_DN8288_c0_g1_i16.p1 TRINITY_DN8288_c0_g1~~TRINITY_DN8288_c0_g1_i16.p1  ORF type:complete len:179 (+),score=20.37 TRINITY_DN8288_c0_g1_i16:73-609(+)